MPIPFSDARRLADRQNGLRSIGFEIEAWTTRLRDSAVEHGLTGAGIALPVQDNEEMDRRFVAIQVKKFPSRVRENQIKISEIGRTLQHLKRYKKAT